MNAAQQERSVWAPVRDFIVHPLGVAILLIAFLSLLYRPGYMSPDSLTIFAGSYALDNITFYHPPIMMWFFALGRGLAPNSQFGVLILQSTLLVLSVLFFASSLLIERRRIRFFLLGFILFPPVLLIAGTLWKSVWALSFLMLALGVAARLFMTRKLSWLVVFAGVAFIAGLSRHDMVAPLGVILFGMAFFLLTPVIQGKSIFAIIGRGAAALAGSFAAFLALYFAVSAANGALATKSMYPQTVTMYHDMLGIGIKTGDITLPKYITDKNPSLEVRNLRAAFNSQSCNAMLKIMSRAGQPNQPIQLPRPSNDEMAKDASRAWLEAVAKHPGAFLQTRAEFSYHLWGFGEKVLLPFYSVVRDNNLPTTPAVGPKHAAIKSVGNWVAYRVEVFHRPWLYMLASVGLLVFFLFFTSGPKSYLGATIVTCGITHFLIMSAAACSADFRYALMIVGMTLAGGYLAFLPPSALRIDQ